MIAAVHLAIVAARRETATVATELHFEVPNLNSPSFDLHQRSAVRAELLTADMFYGFLTVIV